MAGEGRTETAHWVGTSLVAFGFLLPIIGYGIYSAACMEPCGQGGPGTCMFGRATCDLDPVTGWLGASVIALVFIVFGLYLRMAGRVDWYYCSGCGRWFRDGASQNHFHPSSGS